MKRIFAFISILFFVFPSVVSIFQSTANEKAPLNKFLFAASVSLDSEHICSAMILNDWWLITSAYCVAQHNSTEFKVFYGSHNRTHSQRKGTNIEKIEVHPKFDGQRLLNNLALIKITDRIKFIPTVVDAASLSRRHPVKNDAVVAIGWEKLDESHELDQPEMLKCYRTKLVSSDMCWKRCVSNFDAQTFNDQIICTHTTIENTLAPFDSGSALVSAVDNKLIGIASWHEDDIPNAYISIPTYERWIKSVIFV